MDDPNGEVTQLLQRWREDLPEVLDDLTPLVYDLLHAIGSGCMRRERDDHTFQPTALVNELPPPSQSAQNHLERSRPFLRLLPLG
jgi:ECF sigma factor